jgi:uncharacterized protein YcaQ
VKLIQIDSVNVLVRSQELPLFARLGSHPRGVLSAMANDAELFEYWGHVASLIPVEDEPLFRWRMEAARSGRAWAGIVQIQHRRPDLVDAIVEEITERGPLAASDFGRERRAGPWWDWSDAKLVLELLFWTGQLSARRRGNFERVYDLRERMFPAHVLAAPTPSEEDAQRTLLAKAAAALGVAWPRDLADYFRLKVPASRPLIADLVEEGILQRVHVDGVAEPALLHRDARPNGRVEARALLSPFDSLIWERNRTERLFGFFYRIAIYTPAAKREHGYYVLPFLHGERLVARVDLKADRHARVLRCLAAFPEGNPDVDAVAGALAEELTQMAQWLGLERVVVGRRGALTTPLRNALRATH